MFASALAVSFVLLFAFIYWQTALSENARIDVLLVKQIALIAEAPPQEILWIVRSQVAADLHRLTFAALFSPAGALIAGNVAAMPDGLAADQQTHWVDLLALGDGKPRTQHVVAVAQRLRDGRMLVLARDIEELSNLRHSVSRALELGVIPAVLLALGAGAWAGHWTALRLRTWQVILGRVREGLLHERLPVRARGDDIDRLASGVNHMLDELERLFGELHNVGNNIAHDLRTPLARVRAQLERTRRETHTREDMDGMIDKIIAVLDQSIAITTALLRIAEIESSRRRDAFARFDLVEVAREVADFYEPAAEQKRIGLRLALDTPATIFGDRELMFEAVANLVDNAIKFTGAGGQVGIAVQTTGRDPALEVWDTGPGIPEPARDDVLKRFFRTDRSRSTPGAGLGLSLVAAIVKLHGYRLMIGGRDPGCRVVLTCSAGAPAMPMHPLTQGHDAS